jgi:SAM-dependent methyltransferase
VSSAKKIRNVTRKVLQAYGTERIKGYLWDREFARGRWDHLDSTVGDVVYAFIEKFADNGSILDLGCGSGSTGREMAANLYSDYTGVDISEVAIDKAKRRTEESGRADRNRFFRSDIVSYIPDQQFDVILFRDSLYYFALPNIRPILNRFANYLKPGGVFIVRMASRDKHKGVVNVVKCGFDIVGEHLSEQPDALILVFRERVGQ